MQLGGFNFVGVGTTKNIYKGENVYVVLSVKNGLKSLIKIRMGVLYKVFQGWINASDASVMCDVIYDVFF